MPSKRTAPTLVEGAWQRLFGALVAPPAAAVPPASTASSSAARATAFAWRPVVRQAVTFWLATRVMYAIFVYFALVMLGPGRNTPLHPQDLLTSWERWDANWYLNIAQQGYLSTQSTAFLPLFPMLIRAGILLGLQPTVAGLVAGNLGTLLAFIGVGLFASFEDGEAGGQRTLRLLIAYPVAFYLVTIYSDGLFIGFAALALYFTRRGQWGAVALCAFLAGLIRPTSVALILPVLWEFGRQHGWWQRFAWRERSAWRERLALVAQPRVLAQGALAVGAVPAGIGVFAIYCWRRFGDPLTSWSARKYWGHNSPYLPIWKAFPAAVYHFWRAHALSVEQARALTDLVPFIIVATVTLVYVRRVPVMYTLYVGGLLVLTLWAAVPYGVDFLQASGRYLIEAVPTFMILARALRRWPTLEFTVIAGGFLVQAVLLVYYLTGGLLI
jgi:hypothetical protein